MAVDTYTGSLLDLIADDHIHADDRAEIERVILRSPWNTTATSTPTPSDAASQHGSSRNWSAPPTAPSA